VSLATHLGYEQSKRDDLEKLGHTLIYLMKGRLPWQRINIKNKEDKYNKTKQHKMDLGINPICRGLPKEMAIYLNYCENLKFDETPDYEALKKLFRNYLYSQKLDVNFKFDWQASGVSKNTHKVLSSLPSAVSKDVRLGKQKSRTNNTRNQ